jgi:hypothetical protein
MAPIIPHYPKRRSDVHVRVVDGETLILDRQGQSIHRLNPTASAIWQRCDGTATVADIADHLVRAFDVDRPRAAHDAAVLVCQLQQLGLFEPDEGTQGLRAPRRAGPCGMRPSGAH